MIKNYLKKLNFLKGIYFANVSFGELIENLIIYQRIQLLNPDKYKLFLNVSSYKIAFVAMVVSSILCVFEIMYLHEYVAFANLNFVGDLDPLLYEKMASFKPVQYTKNFSFLFMYYFFIVLKYCLTFISSIVLYIILFKSIRKFYLKKKNLSFRRSAKKFYKKSERSNTKIALVICFISSITLTITFGFRVLYINSKTINVELRAQLDFIITLFMEVRSLVNFPIFFMMSKKFNKAVKDNLRKLKCGYVQKKMETFKGARRKSTAKVGFDDIQLEAP